MINKDRTKARNISNSRFARKRRKLMKKIKLQQMINIFRKKRKLRKRR